MDNRAMLNRLKEIRRMAKKSFLGLLNEALAEGPANATEVCRRMMRAGWSPKMRPAETSYGTCHAMNRRLLWRAKAGHLACLLVAVNGRAVNLYVAADRVREAAGRFDLADPTTRLIAADWLEERGDQELAGLLRKARRWTFGGGS